MTIRAMTAVALMAAVVSACEQQTVETEGPAVLGENQDQDTVATTEIDPYGQAAGGGEMIFMVGDSLYGQADEEIGAVEGFVLNGEPMVIVSVGEYLGLGAKNVLLPASELIERAEGGYTIVYTEDELQAMEAYEPEADTAGP